MAKGKAPDKMPDKIGGDTYASMTVRESFAQAAMLGFLRSPYWNLSHPDPTAEPTRSAMEGLASLSVAMADMLVQALLAPVILPEKSKKK